MIFFLFHIEIEGKGGWIIGGGGGGAKGMLAPLSNYQPPRPAPPPLPTPMTIISEQSLTKVQPTVLKFAM